MNDFSQLGFEDSRYEYTLRVREKAEIRTVAKFIGVAYLISILVPDILSYIIIDLTNAYNSLEFIARVFTDPTLSLFYQIIIYVLSFTLPFFVVSIGLTKKTKDLLSFGRPEKGLITPLIFIGLGFCAFANIASSAVVNVFKEFGLELYSPSYSNTKTIPEFILTFCVVAIAPAIVEEFAYRGIVLGALRKFGDGFAILISSLVFGLMHRNLAQIPFAFLVGIVLAFATIKTGSIITSSIIHFLNNALSLVLSTVVENLGETKFASIIYLLYFAICFVLFFIGILIISKKGKEVWTPVRTTHKLTTKQRVICFFSQPVVVFDLVLTIFTALSLILVIKP